MKISIITAFPKSFSFLTESIPKRAVEKGLAEINLIDLREFGIGKHKKIDDRPFGGEEGMVLMFEPIYRALKSIDVYPEKSEKTKVILMSARGEYWTQRHAEKYLLEIEHLILICGHYEGVDQRVIDELVNEEISIGRFILSGGELASMVIVDSILRLIPGVVGNEVSVERETEFYDDKRILEFPHYTRPEVITTDEGKILDTPKVLLSGNHKEIEGWKRENSREVNE
jgi:tRNA (guanine37-N1)-methyltransferase